MSDWNMKEGSVWQQDDGSGDISPENLPDYCEWLENRVAYLEAMVERLIEVFEKGKDIRLIPDPEINKIQEWAYKLKILVTEWKEREENGK